LQGERAPMWSSDVKGSFFGLTLNHKREHFIRAAMEGVIYNLYAVYLPLREVIGKDQITSLQATDGFARSELWRQMLVDIFNKEDRRLFIFLLNKLLYQKTLNLFV